MAVNETAHSVEQAANEWLARLDRGDLQADELQAFRAWLSSDRRHRGAYVRASAAWHALDRGRALAQLTPEQLVRGGYVPQVIEQAPASFNRRLLLGGLAATAVAGMVGVWLWDRQEYTTQIGEIRRFALPDGTLAVLSSSSRIAINFARGRRAVKLHQGEVWFDVAKDRSRPFVVTAARLVVQAVGTAFSVQRVTAAESVLVTEGIIDAWNDSVASKQRVSSGNRAKLTEKGDVLIEAMPESAMRKSLAWREGSIELDGETVAEAAAQFNRFNLTKLVIDDAELAEQRVVGRFNALDSAAFAESVGLSFNAQATIRTLPSGKEIHLRTQKQSSAASPQTTF